MKNVGLKKFHIEFKMYSNPTIYIPLVDVKDSILFKRKPRYKRVFPREDFLIIHVRACMSR